MSYIDITLILGTQRKRKNFAFYLKYTFRKISISYDDHEACYDIDTGIKSSWVLFRFVDNEFLTFSKLNKAQST